MKTETILGVLLAGLAGYSVSKLAQGLLVAERAKSIVSKVKTKKRATKFTASKRLEKILKFLSSAKSADMDQIHSIFPRLSRRTLRRYMDKLEEVNAVEQVGLTKDSKYILIK